MKNAISIVSFELNNKNLLEDWKGMSKVIGDRFKDVDGFISRDVAIDSGGKIHCIVKWEEIQKQKKFKNIFENELFEKSIKDCKKIVNLKTIEETFLEII